jgi:hypothetical protein
MTSPSFAAPNLPYGSNDLLNSPMSHNILPMPSGESPNRDFDIDPLLFLGPNPGHIESPLDINNRLFNNASSLADDQLHDLFNPVRPAPASFLPPSFDMLDFRTDSMWDAFADSNNEQSKGFSYSASETPSSGVRRRSTNDFGFENLPTTWNPDDNALQLSLPDEPTLDDIERLTASSSSSERNQAEGGAVGFEAYNRCVRNLQDIHTISPFAKHYLHAVDSRDHFNKLIHSYFNNCSSYVPAKAHLSRCSS